MRPHIWIVLVGVLVLFVAPGRLAAQDPVESPDDWIELDPEYTLYVQVPAGRIVIALSKNLAQNHVNQMKTLAREHYFDGLPFARVIGGFIAQAGDEAEERKTLGTAAEYLEAEFDESFSEDLNFVPLRVPDEYGEQTGFIDGFPAMRSLSENRVWLTGCTGAVGMPRGNDPNSARAGFWIALQSVRFNDRNNTIFGRVVGRSMDYAALMPRASRDDESSWTIIESVRVAADLPIEQRTPLEIRNTSAANFPAFLESERTNTNPWYVTESMRLDVCTRFLVCTRAASKD
ncbi:MAG: peptidylprolyl isomerase [Gemmatimonadales bacterium]